MKNISISEILEATGGILLSGNLSEEVSSISINSKEIKKKSLFVPIKGEKTDAHDYIKSAFDNGAVATFTQRDEILDNKKVFIKVENTVKALQDLAEYYRKKLNIFIIGVTGSVGKTSTREMIASALSQKFKVFKTSKNFNGQIGLPLTMLDIDDTYEVAVIEMGMSEFGEMEKIARIAKPDYAVITNIGISHIENLKTQENILKEKLHIKDYFKNYNKIFVNGDDKLLKNISNTITFGLDNNCEYKAENILTFANNTSFDFVSNNKKVNKKILIPTIGTHNVYNTLVSLAIGLNLEISIEDMQKGLISYKSPEMRQSIYKLKEITVIDDSYNASPDSMRGSLEVLNTLSKGKRSIAILADMLELGEHSEKSHFEVGEYVAELGIDELISIGKRAEKISEGARSKSSDIIVNSFCSNSEVISYLKKILKPNNIILIKGSRGMKTDEIVNYLKNNFI